MIADDLAYATIAQVENLIVAAGYSGSNCYFEWSDDDGQTVTGGPTLIGPSDEEQPAIVVLETGEILVTLTYAGVGKSYLSRNWGATWTYLEALS